MSDIIVKVKGKPGRTISVGSGFKTFNSDGIIEMEKSHYDAIAEYGYELAEEVKVSKAKLETSDASKAISKPAKKKGK